MSSPGNLFADLPLQLPDELFQTLLVKEGVRIERIISQGHITPAGEWYDQDWDEWVLLLQGEAKLRYADASEPIVLKPGDYLFIPAHVLHRVEWTAPDVHTVWLAVHLH